MSFDILTAMFSLFFGRHVTDLDEQYFSSDKQDCEHKKVSLVSTVSRHKTTVRGCSVFFTQWVPCVEGCGCLLFRAICDCLIRMALFSAARPVARTLASIAPLQSTFLRMRVATASFSSAANFDAVCIE